MELERNLEEIGLTQKQAAVYLALLKIGKASAIAIADKARIKRPTTYLILEELRQKDLVVVMPDKNKTLYIPSTPLNLKEQLDRKQDICRNTLPELLNYYNPKKIGPSVKFYDGIEGMKEVYRDTIHEKEDILAFTAVTEAFMSADLVEFIFDEYLPNRLKHKIHAKVISPKTKESINYQNEDEDYLRVTKLIKSSEDLFTIEKNIYGSKIGLLSYKPNERFGIIIESPEIAKSEKAIFDAVWGVL
jgi:sugar-specific transcriptional regulator TrmB